MVAPQIDPATDFDELADEFAGAQLSDFSDLEALGSNDSELDAEQSESEISGELPPTPTPGTGLHDQPSFAIARGSTRLGRQSEFHAASPLLTGGDLDANYEQAYAVGDEAVGGTAPTPDMDIVDELGAAVGLEMDDRAFLRTTEILEQRDSQRWELEPSSAEDYDERQA